VVYHLEIASNKHLSYSYLLFLLLFFFFFVRCQNEVWKVSGSTIISQIIGAPQPLCLTGLDPSTGPYSQVIADVCDVNNPGQQWLIDSTTNHIRLPAWPIDSQCLTLFSPPLVDAYMKTMNNGDISIALLNRGTDTIGPQTIDLTILVMHLGKKLMFVIFGINQQQDHL
jgi:hypothetical protein